MAGIGFELRKAIQQDTLKAKVSGYAGAAFSSSGSMLVGIVLFFFIQMGAKMENIPQETTDKFMCFVTNTMFFSMICVAIFSLVLSRYVSNCIYEDKYEKVMPSLIGASVLLSTLGGSVFMVLMIISRLSLGEIIALLFLYVVLTNCWLLMSYITVIKSYKWITIAYLSAFLIAILFLAIICSFFTLSIIRMIIVLLVGFSIVDIILFLAVYRAFPNQDSSFFTFMSEFKNSPTLGVINLFMMIGMLGHFWVTWFASPESVTAIGLFRFGPNYDFPAIVAYFSTIPASIYFITIFETTFSEKYQRYFYLLGHGGTLSEVNLSREEMIESIRVGIRRIAQIQVISCLLFTTVGGKLLAVLNIGMTETMLDTFRLFCVGYSLYFIANMIVLLHLYFINEQRIAWSTLIFSMLTTFSAYLSAKYFPNTFGGGFFVMCGALVIVVGGQLVKYLSKLEYHVFTDQFGRTSIKSKKGGKR